MTITHTYDPALYVLVPREPTCPKGGTCEWRIDGMHSNEFCSKCYQSKPKAAAAPSPPAPPTDDARLREFAEALDMLLFCPACHAQHIDARKPCTMGVGCSEAGACFAAAHDEPDRCDAWSNPPHRSHLCHQCGHIWRPADVFTNGVQSIKTKGKADSPAAALQSQADATDAARLAKVIADVSTYLKQPLSNNKAGVQGRVTAAVNSLDRALAARGAK